MNDELETMWKEEVPFRNLYGGTKKLRKTSAGSDRVPSGDSKWVSPGFRLSWIRRCVLNITRSQPRASYDADFRTLTL
jgi:hypothetical protein